MKFVETYFVGVMLALGLFVSHPEYKKTPEHERATTTFFVGLGSWISVGAFCGDCYTIAYENSQQSKIIEE